MLEFTGERYVPDVTGEIRHEHLHRYGLALGLLAGKDVLDIACGEGYGSAMLAAEARSVIGIDNAAKVVAHARKTYKKSTNLTFEVGDAKAIPLDDQSVDVVVSFETIEHLAEQDEMLAQIARVLRPGGLLIIS